MAGSFASHKIIPILAVLFEISRSNPTQPQLNGETKFYSPQKCSHPPPNLEPIKNLIYGSDFYSDTLAESVMPCWYDHEMALIGQEFARKNLLQLIDAHFLSLIMLLGNQQVRRILYTTQGSHTQEKAFKRYTATVIHIQHWYKVPIFSPLWLKSIENVRKIHVVASVEINSSNLSEPLIVQGSKILEDVKIDEKMWEAFQFDLENSPWNSTNFKPAKVVPKHYFNQFLMSLTQWAFVGLPVSRTEEIGIPRWTPKELEGFAHLWAVIGYVLGMNEKFIICQNALTNMTRCKEDAWEILNEYFMPNLFHLDFEAKVMIEAALQSIKELVPPFPQNVWLIHILEDVLQVPAYKMREIQSWQSRVGRFLYTYFMRPFTSWPSMQRLYNFMLHGEMQLASKRTFGDPGTDPKTVAEKLYYF